MLLLYGLDGPLYLRIGARCQKLLKIPRAVQAEAEIRMIDRQLHRFVDCPAMNGPNFGLVIGITDVEVNLGDTYNVHFFIGSIDCLWFSCRPLIFKVRPSVGLRGKFAHKELYLLFAEVMAAVQIAMVMFPGNCHFRAAARHHTVAVAEERIYFFL